MANYLDAAIEIAREAGQILMAHRGVGFELKGDYDLVTAADRASEQFIINRLRQQFPAHGIVAEEGGRAELDAPYRWYIDPLDGTTNFAHGFPMWNVTLGLAHNNEVIAGVVYDPLNRELFAAERGAGARLNGAKIHVSQARTLNDALVSTGFPSRKRHQNINIHFYYQLAMCTHGVRRGGSAAIDLAYTACGRLEGFWEFGLNPWDMAAGTLLVEEAGGKVSSMRGGPFDVQGKHVLADNGLIHEETVELFREIFEGRCRYEIPALPDKEWSYYMAELPEVPLTTEGAYTLHQMFRFSRAAWRPQEAFHRDRMLHQAVELLGSMEAGSQSGHPNQSAIYSHIGHKGDLLFLHFRESLDEIHRAELAIQQLELADFLEPTHSYLSVVELGLYESTGKTYAQLAEKGIEPHSPEWRAGVAEVLARQSAAMASRLYPAIPSGKYLCFYPMDRKRGEAKNWYQVSLPERQRMMHEHGMIGRRYADSVKQIITGSIGFDDWEWGVDLFADDPLVFKKLIYEMRFDEVSAVYALFGSFYVGLRVAASDLPRLLAGDLP